MSLDIKEIRVTLILAGIFSLRVLGLFMIFPVFAISADQYTDCNNQLIGIAIGVYGLVQALLQIPFGILSDLYDRKIIIFIGLGLLIVGSLIAAASSSIYGIIIGRAIQGSGAIGCVIMALLADHTREQARIRAMAILGAVIGASFMMSVIIGPIINKIFGIRGIFNATAVLAAVGMMFLFMVPNRVANRAKKNNNSINGSGKLIINSKLLGLYTGIFVLHASFASLFLIVPLLIQNTGFIKNDLWKLYGLTLCLALPFIVVLISYFEKKRKVVELKFISILGLVLAESILFYSQTNLSSIIGGLIIFFVGFSILEATLPALVSKCVPIHCKGTALGVYSSSQFLGIFFGGTVGGWLHGKYGVVAVFVMCIFLTLSWLVILGFNKRWGVSYG